LSDCTRAPWSVRCPRRIATFPATRTLSSSPRQASVGSVKASSEAPEPSTDATSSPTRSVTAAYSMATEAVDGRGSDTLMDLQPPGPATTRRSCERGLRRMSEDRSHRRGRRASTSDGYIIHQLSQIYQLLTRPPRPRARPGGAPRPAPRPRGRCRSRRPASPPQHPGASPRPPRRP
jgi:hypothetical protein